MQVESHEGAHESEIPSLNESPCPSEASSSSSPSRRSDEVDDPKTVFLGGVPQDSTSQRLRSSGRDLPVEHVPGCETHAQEVRGEEIRRFPPVTPGLLLRALGTERRRSRPWRLGVERRRKSAMRTVGRRRRVRRGDRQTREACPRWTNTRKSTCPGTVHAVAAAAAAAAAPYDPYAYYPHPGPVGYYDPYDPCIAQYAAQVHYAQAAQYAHAMQQAQHAHYAAAMHSSLYGITPPASPTAALGGRWSPSRSPGGWVLPRCVGKAGLCRRSPQAHDGIRHASILLLLRADRRRKISARPTHRHV